MGRASRQQKPGVTLATKNTSTNGLNMGTKEDKNDKLNNLQFGILAFLVAVIIMTGILAGAFYLIVHNNIYDVAEKYRKEIQNRPLLKWALPEPPDPEDPEYMTDSEMRNKYKEIKKQRDKLLEDLNQANRVVEELKIYKDGYEKILLEKEEERIKLAEEKRKIQEDREEIQTLGAQANKEGFKKYYETMDKDNAEALYREILLEEKIDTDVKKFVQIYEDMDEVAAARIFDEMGEQKIGLVVEILLKMKKENSSTILAEMEPAFASKVTEKMAEGFLGIK